MYTSGHCPPSTRGFGPTRSTLFQYEPTGTLLITLQLIEQARHPTHLFKSVKIEYCVMIYSLPSYSGIQLFRRSSSQVWMMGVPSSPQGTGLPNGEFSGVALYTFTP